MTTTTSTAAARAAVTPPRLLADIRHVWWRETLTIVRDPSR